MTFKRLLPLLAVVLLLQAQDCAPPNNHYDANGYFFATRTPYPAMPEDWHNYLTPVPLVIDHGPNYDPNLGK